MRRRVSILIAVASALGVLGFQSLSAAASFTFTKPQWDGLAMFLEIARDELGPERVVLEATVDWEQLKPQDALLVFHPETDLSFSETSAFLAAGGRLGFDLHLGLELRGTESFAMMPLALGRENRLSCVFLTRPSLVAMNT